MKIIQITLIIILTLALANYSLELKRPQYITILWFTGAVIWALALAVEIAFSIKKYRNR